MKVTFDKTYEFLKKKFGVFFLISEVCILILLSLYNIIIFYWTVMFMKEETFFSVKFFANYFFFFFMEIFNKILKFNRLILHNFLTNNDRYKLFVKKKNLKFNLIHSQNRTRFYSTTTLFVHYFLSTRINLILNIDKSTNFIRYHNGSCYILKCILAR